MNSDTWTTIGKGGKPVPFPPEAMAAFGSKRTAGPPRFAGGGGGAGGRSEFPTEAASAFGRKPRRDDDGHGHGFDPDAQSAFGSRRPRSDGFDPDAQSAFGSRRQRPDGFDSAATAAFGGGSRRSGGDFPDAFGGRPSRRVEGGEYPRPRAPPTSAPAPAPAVKQTYEEMFPVLGVPTPAPVPAGASKPTTATGAGAKPSFADLMRKHAEKDANDTAEAERRAMEEAEAREKEEKDRALLRRLYRARNGGSYNSDKYRSDAGGDEYDDYADHGDLDHDGYGSIHRETHPAPSYSRLGDVGEEEPDTDDGGNWETA